MAWYIYVLSAMLFAFYVLLFVLEQRRPLRKATQAWWPRIAINLLFTVIVYVLATFLIKPVAVGIVNFSTKHAFGLLPWLHIKSIFAFIFGFLLLDLTFYYWHRLNHEWRLLWRFHNVHHCDRDLDVTTSMRFHFVEILYSLIFRILQLLLLGVGPVTFFFYEIMFQANTFFQHSNIRLPFNLERVMNKIIVTPRMHGIHHSGFADETNRNYSVVLSIWDRLHRTMKLNIPQEVISIGVPGYVPEANNISKLLLMPMQTQKPYWQVGEQRYLRRSQQVSHENTTELSP